MHILADRLKATPTNRYLAYLAISALAFGAVWSMLGMSWSIFVLWAMVEEYHGSPRHLIDALLLPVFSLLFLVPGICGIILGYRLLKRTTSARIKGAVASLTFMMAIMMGVFAGSALGQVFPVDIANPIATLSVLIGSLWIYGTLCRWIERAAEIERHSTPGYIRKPIIVVGSLIVCFQVLHLLDALVAKQIQLGLEPPIRTDLPVMVVATLCAFVFYLFANRFLDNQSVRSRRLTLLNGDG